MRREGLFRPIGTRRWPLAVWSVIALMLLPMQGVGAADGIGASPKTAMHRGAGVSGHLHSQPVALGPQEGAQLRHVYSDAGWAVRV